MLQVQISAPFLHKPRFLMLRPTWMREPEQIDV